MKKILLFFIAVITVSYCSFAQTNLDKLKIVFIRHAEKPEKGDNLTCQGLNRSFLLPKMITTKFGVPDYLFIPAMALDTNTKHSRMFQTLIPLAVKYNLHFNSKHQEKDYAVIAADIKSKTGTVLVCWEHKAIPFIAEALGIKDKLKWEDDDYETIWIVTFKNGNAIMEKDKEGLNPLPDCSF